MDADGRVIDKELNELGLQLQASVSTLFKAKADWTLDQKIVAAFHLQGYINTEVMRCLMEGLIKKQGLPPHATGLRLTPPDSAKGE